MRNDDPSLLRDSFDAQLDAQLSSWIDEALPAYSGVASPPGLEARILARTSAFERPPQRRLAWLWQLAVPALASFVVAVLVSGRWHGTQHSTPTPAALPSSSVALLAPASERVTPARNLLPAHSRPVRTAKTTSPLPKLDVFPSPVALTSEERTLMANAAQLQQAVPVSGIKDVRIPEIRIAELTIRPLPSADPDTLPTLKSSTNLQP
jgi:hypothetical protein